ncbi:MAG: hypothetical protein HQL69_06910 [Magnetococcales bacterium]|nr:hypothetical protein [Magnetococcales bacterium]
MKLGYKSASKTISVVGLDEIAKIAIKLLTDRDPIIIEYKNKSDLKDNQKDNEKTISNEIGGGANIYALWKRENDSNPWEVMYIGQREKKQVKIRLCQHLFKKPDATNSRIDNVKTIIENRGQIGISTILVEPDTMRKSLETCIINTIDSKLSWNTHKK